MLTESREVVSPLTTDPPGTWLGEVGAIGTLSRRPVHKSVCHINSIRRGDLAGWGKHALLAGDLVRGKWEALVPR